ncbi:MAG: hypothetical protein JXA37_14575 [Chloroflexia bacterium]|nr:hypothetical protein [Chloroflexia bacterium]
MIWLTFWPTCRTVGGDWEEERLRGCPLLLDRRTRRVILVRRNLAILAKNYGRLEYFAALVKRQSRTAPPDRDGAGYGDLFIGAVEVEP